MYAFHHFYALSQEQTIWIRMIIRSILECNFYLEMKREPFHCPYEMRLEFSVQISTKYMMQLNRSDFPSQKGQSQPLELSKA